jgi:N-methylhydantoinase A
VHGTTAATNSVIERNGPVTGLLCTEGFRDVLYFRDGFKPERFNIRLQHPKEFVDRYLRIGVAERLDRQGDVMRPLDESSVRIAATQFREAGVQAVAVAFLWSMINSEHEERAAEILRAELPGCYVVCSHEVMPEIREWERTSATALSAYILPVIDTYLRKLEADLLSAGLRRNVLIMQVNGGCSPVSEILRRPVYALHSGPAAAPAAASWFARDLGSEDLITVDMGGTSFDVCLIRGRKPEMTRNLQVDGQPIGVPAVEVRSIGAGGGSIAWIDAGGALRVGPRSAGAVPGPVCYGAGGNEPTVTDANLVLGYLSPDGFLGGRKQLDAELAAEAIRDRIATPLGLTLHEAAAGIVRVVDANMVGAIRAQSLERGVDPREFVLVVGGGAGGSHACGLARQLGIRRVFVPREAGTFCAFGMTVTDVRHDYARTYHSVSSSLDLAAVDDVFAQLEGEARARLRSDGFTDDEIALTRHADARYPGQVHELTIAVPSAGTYEPSTVAAIEKHFHAEHARHFAYSRPDLPVEFLHWRLSSTGSTGLTNPEHGNGATGDAQVALIGARDVYFPVVAASLETSVYRADLLAPGATLSGPAVVQATTTTLVVNPGDQMRVLPSGGYELAIEA